jgi:hypothetical protein
MRIRKLVELYNEIGQRQKTLKNLWDRQWNASGDLDEVAVEAYKDYKENYEQWLETPMFGCEYCTRRPCQDEQ